jgi:hypothetical protein
LFPFMLLIIILILFTSVFIIVFPPNIILQFASCFFPICLFLSRSCKFPVYLHFHLSIVPTTEAASPEPVFVCCYFVSKLSQNFFIRLLITRKVWNENQIRSKPVSSDEYTQITKSTATNRHFTQRERG